MLVQLCKTLDDVPKDRYLFMKVRGKGGGDR
jgi:hypothetical protein